MKKKWINLVQMASIGKPMKIRPQLILRLNINAFWHSELAFLTSIGAEKGPKMVDISLK